MNRLNKRHFNKTLYCVHGLIAIKSRRSKWCLVVVLKQFLLLFGLVMSAVVAVLLLAILVCSFPSIPVEYQHQSMMDKQIDAASATPRQQQQQQSSDMIVTWTEKLTNKTVNNYSNDRIFFHETSGKMELSFRQNCAVESAALHNPQRPVQIFFQPQQQQQSNASSVVDQSSAWFRALNHYANVQVIVIDDDAFYFKDSPLEDWYRRGEWRNSPYRVQHMADYIRILSLHKEGGMYLDLDVLTLKPYDGPQFRNFVTVSGPRFNEEIVTNSMFHMDRGLELIDAILQEQAEEYDPNEYIFNGPEALTGALYRLNCNDTSSSHRNQQKQNSINNSNSNGTSDSDNANLNNSCGGVHLLPHDVFHPVPSIACQVFFQYTDDWEDLTGYMQLIDQSHAAHFYNSVTHRLPVDFSVNATQIFAILAARHCPFSLNLFR